MNLGPSERPSSPLEKAVGDSISQDRVLLTKAKGSGGGELQLPHSQVRQSICFQGI